MSTLLKDTVREIKNSIGRFLSILLIIALGVGFFAGIKATAPDMKLTAHEYFDNNNLMDYHVISTMGFEYEDKRVVGQVEEVKDVQLGYSMDVILEEEDKTRVMNLLSLPSGYKQSINEPVLVEGRMPENMGECLLETSMKSKYNIGSRIKLDSGTDQDIKDSLKNQMFTVVGFVNSPLYISTERGKSNIGNGKVNSFIIIPEREFKIPYYTDMYLKLKNPDNLNTYSQDYKDYLESVQKDIEELGKTRRTERHDEFKKKLTDKYEEAKDKLEEERLKGEEELKAAENKLNKSKSQLSEGQALYDSGLGKLDQKVKEGENRLRVQEDKFNQAISKYEDAVANISKEEEKAKEEISQGEKELKLARENLKEINSNIENLKDQLDLSESEEEKLVLEEKLSEAELGKAKIEKELILGEEKLEGARAQLEQGRQKLKETKADLDKAKGEIEQGKVKIKEEKARGESQLENEKKKLEDARVKISQGEKDLEEGREKLKEEISKGERDLRKLEREIKKLEKPEWFVIKRTNTKDYLDFEMAADRIDAVAKVFPLFFFLIALLVCLTTMTRMVDEQRLYIGTLKGLGYGDGSIMSKYIIYSLMASILGSILGLFVGFKAFPTVIFNAYRIMYIMPAIITEFNIKYALLSTLAAVATTSLASYLAVRKELRLVPANLLRPKAPKPGKRILLERIDSIWKRLKFSQKVTARNIFRYKKRLFMTIVGIAGCTALLLAGFGLKDSIMSISINQFDKIFQYDMDIDVNDGIASRNFDPVIKFLKDDKRIDSYLLAKEAMVEVKAGEEDKIANLMVLEEKEKYSDYIILRNRQTQKSYSLKDGEILVSEKLAILLDLEVGDEINFKLDDKDYSLKVDGFTENYAYHFIYMNENSYKDIFKEDLEFNKILVNNKDRTKDFEEKLSKEILNIEDVSTVGFITNLSKEINNMLDSLNYVIVVLIISAGALAFIVLYNLTNINISERQREIATIKVLGFYDKEVSRYVYRENNILTLLGTLLGLLVGIVLHRFIILTTEIDIIMFGRDIRKISFVYSAVLTIFFSLLVNITMYYKLKNIDMVESLKSVD